MKSPIAAFLLSAAVLGAMPIVSLAQSAQATQPADAATDVPIKSVVLFSSGVGYFEHAGTVHGDGTTQLRFKTDQINDLLKSLILQDLDGGRVSAIEYPSQDPIDKTLASFQVNINGNPPLADLLTQLRGARVSVTANGDSFDGTILGVETRQTIPLPNTPPITSWRLNLLSGASIRQIDLDKLTDVKLQDAKLQDELTKALAALAQARDQDKKPVNIRFNGQGDRRVRLGYVVATPIWKASYRLLLGDPKDAKDKSQMQGWAIIENQTDNDWKNVQLSLVSGRPLSFIEDLYQPLYLQRPTVTPQLFAGLVPQQYEGGRVMDKDGSVANAALPAAADMPTGGQRSRELKASARSFNSTFAIAAESAPMDAASSVQSLASASQIGELFQYTVGDVSIARQTSAMIPIITEPIEIERLSIYNQNVLPKNPLNGARVKNTTGKHLLTGPITVLDHGSYAGDAQIDNLPPGQERLISFGVDLQMSVDATQRRRDGSLLSGKISKGVLIVSNKDVDTQTYVVTNKTADDRTLIIEHQRFTGAWTLVKGDNKPIETTDNLYRFKVIAPAGKDSSLTVAQETTTQEEIALLDGDYNRVLFLSQQGEIPKAVRDALADVIAKGNATVDLDRRISEANAKLGKYPAEQARIRENIKIFDSASEARRRLQAKLDAQETEIEKQQADVAELQKQCDAARAEYEKTIRDLNVG